MDPQIREEVHSSIRGRLEGHAQALTIVKSVVILGGAAVVGLAQFFSAATFPPTGWALVGAVATCFVFLGGIFVARSDASAPTELDRARRAIEAANDAERRAREQELFYEMRRGDYTGFDEEARRARELYLSVHAMRSALERLDYDAADVDKQMANALLTAANQHLPVALGFEMEHQWTVGIYCAQQKGAGAGVDLVLAADRRAIEQDISKARKWPDGIGFVGMAYSKRQEIIVNDTREPLIRSLFAIGDLALPDDDERYVSFAAVPVLVGPENSPWGVVVATNNQSDHFTLDREPGVHAEEAVRAVAGMVALGASFAAKRTRAKKPS